MKKYIVLFGIISLYFQSSNTGAFCQSRWVKSYFGNLDTPVHYVLEAYDGGYMMVGKFGANYSKYNWLVKTDINGEIMWQKTIGDGQHAIVFNEISEDLSGYIYLVGSTLIYDPQDDPFLIKLNPCGEKEWCRIFHTENHHDFSSCMTLTREGEPVVVLNETNPDPWIDPICLAKLTPDGELIWKQCYTTLDTSQRNEETYDLILTPDNGFLVTGFCYYEDPEVPNLWWPHPYFLKVDSTGNFQWETVVYKETNLHGGIAGSTTLSPNKQYYYSSISHYYYDTNLASPALVKMDMLGNVFGVYDIVNGYKEGKLSYAQFINDSTLAADAGWGNLDDDLWDRAVIIDTLGHLLNSTVLIEDLYVSILQKTNDGKLVYASNTYQNGQFDCFLTKLNHDLQQDTIYTRPFTYDSLCPYQIVSDTIVPDDCGLIVGIEEPGSVEAGKHGGMEAGGHGGLDVWPNPAREVLHGRWTMDDGRFNTDFSLEIYDIFGRIVLPSTPIIPPIGGTGGGWQINVSNLSPGVYIVILKKGYNILGSKKFVVAR